VSNPPSSKRHNSSGKYELSEQAFPFQACPDDFVIDFSNAKKRPLIKGTIQYTFNAHYHSLPVAVACLYKSSSNVEITNFREKVFEYELYMSDRLAACRGMNTYLSSFEAPMESQFKLSGTKITYMPAFCMVLPANGCMDLKDYMKACEEKYITKGILSKKVKNRNESI
jgi:hypothetical protein